MDWNDLARFRDRWRALVNAVMNLRDPYAAGCFLTIWKPVILKKDFVPWNKYVS